MNIFQRHLKKNKINNQINSNILKNQIRKKIFRKPAGLIGFYFFKLEKNKSIWKKIKSEDGKKIVTETLALFKQKMN